MYFETKCRYEKMQENGSFKQVTEPYLVDALTCTEAEARIVERLSPLYNDLEVVSVKQSKLIDVIPADCDLDYWYMVKTDIMVIDARTGEEKHTTYTYLVQAASFNDAKDKFEKFSENATSDWEFVSIGLTPIVDVFLYTET